MTSPKASPEDIARAEKVAGEHEPGCGFELTWVESLQDYLRHSCDCSRRDRVLAIAAEFEKVRAEVGENLNTLAAEVNHNADLFHAAEAALAAWIRAFPNSPGPGITGVDIWAERDTLAERVRVLEEALRYLSAFPHAPAAVESAQALLSTASEPEKEGK